MRNRHYLLEDPAHFIDFTKDLLSLPVDLKLLNFSGVVFFGNGLQKLGFNDGSLDIFQEGPSTG